MLLVPEAYRNHPELVQKYPQVGGEVTCVGPRVAATLARRQVGDRGQVGDHGQAEASIGFCWEDGQTGKQRVVGPGFVRAWASSHTLCIPAPPAAMPARAFNPRWA